MIDHVWTVVCSHAVIDRDSNSVSLLDVVEQLNIREEPSPEGSVILPLDIVTLWVRADFDVPTRGRGRVTFFSPSGAVNDGPFEFDIDLSEHRRNRSRGRLQTLHVGESGRHTFLVELQDKDDNEWHEVAAVPLEINFLPPDRSEQATGDPAR
jgi:hypothetical protein